MMRIFVCVTMAIALIAAVNIQTSSGSALPDSGRLVKRSLCNTFGGCGAKRSYIPPTVEYERSRKAANDKLIGEILEDIIEHLRQDQNYKQGKYTMYVPKSTADYMDRVDPLNILSPSKSGGSLEDDGRNRAENNVHDDIYLMNVPAPAYSSQAFRFR